MAGSIAEFHPGLRFATPDAIAQAAALLARGRLVAFPTETVYGLGADATDESAVVGIFAAKGRPRFNPLIAHVGGLDEASAHGAFDGTARALAEAFWPGPLTLVVPARPGCRIALMARAGLDSVALRAPAHPVARALIAQAGRPLAAPSANRSGRISPTRAADAAEELGSAVDMILDGGACEVGVESTIVACVGGAPALLRSGGVPRAAIEAVIGRALAKAEGDSDAPLAPGRLASHYAPRARVRLGARSLLPGEAGLDFGGAFGGAPRTLDLSPGRDLREAAANLFAHLRALDALAPAAIAVAPIPGEGLGEAIVDRLARAAAER